MIINKKLLDEGAKLTKELAKEDKERFLVVDKGSEFKKYVQPGSFISYTYIPKHKDTLKFWDKNPAIIVLRVTGTRMLGLNIHFVPFPLRKIIVEYIVKLNLNNIKYNKPIYVDYKMMKSFLIRAKATICIRAYLISNIVSKVKIVKSHKDYIIASTSLKTDAIYGMSPDKIYKIAMGQQYETKKKTGSRRVEREKKKKLLKTK